MLAARTSSRRPRTRVWGTAACAIAAVTLGLALAVAAPTPASAQTMSAAAAPVSAASEPVVGATETFWALDHSTNEYSQIQATAHYVGEHVAIYVSDGTWLSSSLVEQLGTAFDTTVYPKLTEAYGSEPDPGIDGDPRVVILIYDFDDPANDVDAWCDTRDFDPDGWNHSNRREMFYLNLKALLTEPAIGPALAAHEFAHLIVHYRDVMLDPSPDAAPESSWLTEGFSTYAEHLAGYDDRVTGQLHAYTRDPDFSLTHWLGVRANYGASYLFMRYLADREGADFIRALVSQPLDAVAGIDATLAATGSPYTFASLFDDWVIANFLNGCSPQVWPYYYSDLSVSVQPDILKGSMPLQGTAEVVDYGAVYLDFPAVSTTAAFQCVVDGADGAPLQAAVLSWDSTGTLSPSVTRLDLANQAVGGTVTAPQGYDRHTLVVWARGSIGSDASYGFAYSGAADPPSGVQFLDLGGDDPFYGFVITLLTDGIIGGREVPSGSGLWFFMGKDNVLRAQFAKMIMKATGLHTAEVDNPGTPTFSDVPAVYDEDGYPYDFVEEAAALGIVTGFSGGTFGPYKPITRSQLVLMITRGAKAAGKPLPAYTGNARVFADVPVSHPYYREIMAAYKAGILTGSSGSDGRLYFYPWATASRNHVAKMTANLVEYLQTP